MGGILRILLSNSLFQTPVVHGCGANWLVRLMGSGSLSNTDLAMEEHSGSGGILGLEGSFFLNAWMNA